MLQIFRTFFNKTPAQIQEALQDSNLPWVLEEKEIRENAQVLLQYFIKHGSLFTRLRYLSWEIGEFCFDNLKILSHKNVDGVLYDYCCYPKQGDEVMGIWENQKVIVHHKLCEKVQINDETRMVYLSWMGELRAKFKLIVILEDKRGALAHFLLDLAKYDCNLSNISYKGFQDQFLTHFEVLFDVDAKNAKELKNAITSKYKIVEFQNLKDAYQ